MTQQEHYAALLKAAREFIAAMDADLTTGNVTAKVHTAEQTGIALRSVLAAAPVEPAPPICNAESSVGHHCQRVKGHDGMHFDRHENFWSGSSPPPSTGEGRRVCPECHGAGVKQVGLGYPDADGDEEWDIEPCPRCGTGEGRKVCPACGGVGWLSKGTAAETRCPHCGGTGEVGP